MLVIAASVLLLAVYALASLSHRLKLLEFVLDSVTGLILRAIARRVTFVDVWLGIADREQLLLLESFVFTLLFGIAAGVYLLYRIFRSRAKQQSRSRKKRP